MEKSKFISTVALVVCVMIGMPRLVQAQGVEEGIRQLAEQIVERSASADKTTIAISAFPHADDTCSELSNYIADELVLNLFSVPGNNLSIVERSQLGQIFSEIELSMTGAVDANTTQELGRIAGVDTLLVGSITDMGDELRVNARMLDTETAQVFSAAAVNIPRTSTIQGLFERRASSGCSMVAKKRSLDGRRSDSDRTEPTNSRAELRSELDMKDMVGKWSGSVKCMGVGEKEGSSDSGPRTMELFEPNPIGVRGTYFRDGEFNGQSYSCGQRSCKEAVTLTLDLKREGVWFILPLGTEIPLQLVSDGVLFGEGSVNEWKCQIQFGKISN